MSLASRFGLSSQAKQEEIPQAGVQYVNLASCLRVKAQNQAAVLPFLAVHPDACDLSENQLHESPDGGLSFTVYVDTRSALEAVKAALLQKDFAYSRIVENKLVAIHQPSNVSFKIFIQSDEDSACTSRIRFTAPYITSDVREFNFPERLMDLYRTIAASCQ